MLEAVVSAFELGQCLHVRFVSFRFALKGFAWRQTAARCFTGSQSPKTLSCARVWLKKKTECYALCFSHKLQLTLLGFIFETATAWKSGKWQCSVPTRPFSHLSALVAVLWFLLLCFCKQQFVFFRVHLRKTQSERIFRHLEF